MVICHHTNTINNLIDIFLPHNWIKTKVNNKIIIIMKKIIRSLQTLQCIITFS